MGAQPTPSSNVITFMAACQHWREPDIIDKVSQPLTRAKCRATVAIPHFGGQLLEPQMINKKYIDTSSKVA